MRMLNGTMGLLAAAAAAVLLAGPASAQTPEEFYRGKRVTFVVSAAPGGGADLYARAFVKYFSRHLPGQPQVVITNVPGAGGLTAAAQLQNNAPKDGTVVSLLQRNNLYLPLVSAERITFDPRQVNWIGSFNKETYALATWHTAPVKTLADLFVRPIKLGATSFNNENRTFPAIINEYLGGKMDIIAGYKGNDEIALAMERGEVHGRALTITSLLSGNDANWLRDRKINVIAQLGVEKSPHFPDVPLIMDHVKDPKAKALFEFMFLPLQGGRPVAAPPGVPADRVAALRRAFAAAVEDPEFVADLAKQNATAELLKGEDLQQIVATLYASPPEVLALARELLKPQ